MKKKIVCTLFAALFTLTAFGCSSGDANVSFDETKPWQSAGYEVSEYSITKIHNDGSSYTDVVNGAVVADGTYTSKLQTFNDTTTVTNNFVLNYNNSSETTILDSSRKFCINKGLTDSYDAEVTFKKESLVPVSASKNHNIAQRPLNDDAMPEPQLNPAEGIETRYTLSSAVKYADPRSYNYSINYEDNTASFSTTKATTAKQTENGETTYLRDYSPDSKDFTVKNNTRFDNEQLAYVVRAIANTKLKGSATFYLSNIYDSYLNNKYVRYTMRLSCADKNTDMAANLDADQYLLYDAEGELSPVNGKYVVPCIKATISVSSSTPGPAIVLFITDPSITIAKRDTNVTTKKIVVQMIYTEYLVDSAKVGYQTVYTLTNYTI